ncbi:MAG TPA: ABC transporter permease, partial [Vicinamibacterales bacterium]|nr:ABC transporter permease [Vicinamibacterales bacterium]
MDTLRQFFRRLAAPFRFHRAEHELAREIRAHLQLLEDRFIAQGMSPEEARYAAQRAFGGVEQAKEHQRNARSFRWIDDSRIDFKLGARMLVKYPGLTLVGGFGLAAAIAIGMSAFAFFYAYIYAPLPIDEADRVVAVENWNVEINNEERRALHDFVEWRSELRTITDLSAFRAIGRNLIIPGGTNEPVQIAEMTGSAFALTRVSPVLGRWLVADDERIGAPAVVVIGHDVWHSRFGASPDVLGREVRLGNTVHTIVGVMPEGFKFPINHSYWTPLRIDLSAFGRRQGPAVFIFGRLAPGVDLADAQAEVKTIGDRASAQFPDTHARLEPRVMPYAHPIMDIQGITAWQFASMQATMSVLLVVVAVNLGILVYARTATRHGEIAIRTALGATRRRIVGQLFIESLVLAAIAAAVGLLLSRYGMRAGHQIMQLEGPGAMPYWVSYGIPAAAYGYLILVTLLAAVISGVIPALRATGRQVQNTLRELGGSSGLRLGRTWTALIVAQVALSVAGLPMAISSGWGEARAATTRPAFAAERFIVAPFRIDPEPPPSMNAAEYRRDAAIRFQKLHSDFAARVEAEPEVSDVTMAAMIPGDESRQRIEVDQQGLASDAATVYMNRIADDFFDAFDAPMLTGRRLTPGDIGGNAVVVNRAFVQRVLGNGPALGRRIRYRADTVSSPAAPAAWHEIVGVVGDLQINRSDPSLVDPVVFHMLDATQATTLTLIVRTRGGDASALAPRLRDIAVSLDPTVRITPRPMLELYRQMDLALRLVVLVLALIVVSVLLLSAAGIYAMMSFTVSQRRKEIGIRAAMGADSRRLLISVFSRAAAQ